MFHCRLGMPPPSRNASHPLTPHRLQADRHKYVKLASLCFALTPQCCKFTPCRLFRPPLLAPQADRHKYVKLAYHGFAPLTREQRMEKYNNAGAASLSGAASTLGLPVQSSAADQQQQ